MRVQPRWDVEGGEARSGEIDTPDEIEHLLGMGHDLLVVGNGQARCQVLAHFYPCFLGVSKSTALELVSSIRKYM